MTIHNPFSKRARAARLERRIARRHRDFAKKVDHIGDSAHATMYGINTDRRP